MKKIMLGAAPLAASAGLATAQTNAPTLSLVAESQAMIWNAVTLDRGRIFVSGPRWTGSRGPQLALLDGKGRAAPFPDVAWNDWSPGKDPASTFVDVNALHRAPNGDLFVVDTGSPTFGGAPLPNGAKVVRIDLGTDKVIRIYRFAADVALPGGYIDDIRIHGDTAYLTDAGRPGLIVLDLKTGNARRVLSGAPSVTASNRPIVVAGEVVLAPDGKPLKVHSDPMELSPDGRYLYFGPLNGPWSRIETQWLDDPRANSADHVEPWAELPPVGGTAMAPNGDLYFTDLAENAVKRRTFDGHIQTIVSDPRLHWVDAPYLDSEGSLWLPVPQLDRIGIFHGGRSKIAWPTQLFRLTFNGTPTK